MNNSLEYQTVILSALLHDIGKFLHRGRDLSFDIKGTHPEVSGQFVNLFADVFGTVADVNLLRALVQKKEELQQAKADIEERLRHEILDTVDLNVVQHYTSDLRNLLVKSSITEQRSFLKSFVEKIEADDEKVKMYYTIPVPPDSIVQETTGVLPFVHHG